MDRNDQNKAIQKGFTLIRKCDYPTPRIKFRDSIRADFRIMMVFGTKEGRDRSMKLLKKDERYLED